MKKIQEIVILFCLVAIFSCSEEAIISEQLVEGNTSSVTKSSNYTSGNNGLTYSPHQLIMKYKLGTPDTMKYNIRESHGIDGDNINPQQGFGAFEICKCTNQDIEIWNFPGDIDIEHKKQAMDGEINGETHGLKNIDYEYKFGFESDDITASTATDLSYESYIKTANNGVTIAVLDTGITPQLTVFNDGDTPIKFLYKATPDMAVDDEASGRDFVNNDNNTFDDDMGKHGSIITDLIIKSLTSYNIPHQILPVKIANNNGSISYWNLLCGSLYAFERADVVNMSLGWYDDGFGDFDDTILANLLTIFNHIPVITSAGNSNNDNDIRTHYPSSYPHNNVIAVAACNAAFTEASDFSNFGAISVDFFTKGESIPFYDAEVEGTSFAAPYVTTKVARLIYFGYSIESLRLQLDTEGIPVTDAFTLGKQTYYGKYLYP